MLINNDGVSYDCTPRDDDQEAHQGDEIRATATTLPTDGTSDDVSAVIVRQTPPAADFSIPIIALLDTGSTYRIGHSSSVQYCTLSYAYIRRANKKI